jgi:hypothetical protein
MRAKSIDDKIIEGLIDAVAYSRIDAYYHMRIAEFGNKRSDCQIYFLIGLLAAKKLFGRESTVTQAKKMATKKKGKAGGSGSGSGRHTRRKNAL